MKTTKIVIKNLFGIREANSRIERAKAFREGFEAKKRGLEAERDIQLAAVASHEEARQLGAKEATVYWMASN